MNRIMCRSQLLFSLILMVFIYSGCAVNPVTGKKEVMLMSEEREIAIGKEADPSIVAQYGLYDDEVLQKFIDEKGQLMAKVSHRDHLDYEFKILDSPVINAFALPGGYVYFTRGILAHFNNEAEFAGVLGHEIGHVTARHSAKQQSKAQVAQVLLVGGMLASKEFRAFGNSAQQGLGLLFLKFGRDNESESDRLGVEYSTKINYDANEMAGFFRTLQRIRDQSGDAGQIPTFMSTHPDPANRFENVQAKAREWKAKLNNGRLTRSRVFA
ncbi:MAG: M48 family metallopeptidase, partial [Bacteroidota bacterium]